MTFAFATKASPPCHHHYAGGDKDDGPPDFEQAAEVGQDVEVVEQQQDAQENENDGYGAQFHVSSLCRFRIRLFDRSEERRVGEEGRVRWWPRGWTARTRARRGGAAGTRRP